jgi:hypothetical protein
VDSTKEVVALQSKSGYKLIKSICCPIFILSSSWPSWALAARACGCTNLYLSVQEEDEYMVKVVDAIVGLGEHRVSLEIWKKTLCELWMKGNVRKVVVLLQLDTKDTQDMWKWLEMMRLEFQGEDKELMVITGEKDLGSSKDRGRRIAPGLETGHFIAGGPMSSMWISHKHVGGALEQGWTFSFNWCLTPEEENGILEQVEVKAELGDYLSTITDGLTCQQPSSGKPGGSLKWGAKGGRVRAKCVFSPTGWVERSMSMDEVLDVYDVGRSERAAMKLVWGEYKEKWSWAFTRQIPMRVLLRCLEVVLHQQEGTPGRRRNGNTLVKGEEKRRCLGIEDEDRVEAMELQVLGMLPKESTVRGTKGAEKANDKLEAKNDHAQAQVEEWNRRALAYLIKGEALTSRQSRALDVVRRAMLRRYRHYKYGVIRSFRLFMKKKHGINWMEDMWKEGRKRRGKKEIGRDYTVGLDAIHRASNASFWDWSDGSTVFFWRWPEELQDELRDGMQVWFRKQDLPTFWGRQRWPTDEKERSQLKEKIGKVLSRRYVSEGYVSSLTGFFAVPKGTDDIRVVYDATRSGLNDAIWAPNFFLPTIDSVLSRADENTYFGDIDVGEMFLNYFLDSRLRPRAGVDVTELASAFKVNLKPGQRWILRWERSLMGVRSSPFNCVRIYLLGEEIIRGDRHATSNPFRWDYVVMNLPGTKGYDPTKPWMFLYDAKNRRMAAFVVSYVDDLRTGSQGGQEDGDAVVHLVASKLNYLGQQDAARKRGFASRKPGAWAGAVVEAELGDGLYVTVSQDKWDKVRGILKRYMAAITEPEDGKGDVWLEKKTLERDVGFLVHVFMTYSNLRPFLKGFYLTLNGWRSDRNKEGWKRKASEMEEDTSFSDVDADTADTWEDGGSNIKTQERHQR